MPSLLLLQSGFVTHLLTPFLTFVDLLQICTCSKELKLLWVEFATHAKPDYWQWGPFNPVHNFTFFNFIEKLDLHSYARVFTKRKIPYPNKVKSLASIILIPENIPSSVIALEISCFDFRLLQHNRLVDHFEKKNENNDDDESKLQYLDLMSRDSCVLPDNFLPSSLIALSINVEYGWGNFDHGNFPPNLTYLELGIKMEDFVKKEIPKLPVSIKKLTLYLRNDSFANVGIPSNLPASLTKLNLDGAACSNGIFIDANSLPRSLTHLKLTSKTPISKSMFPFFLTTLKLRFDDTIPFPIEMLPPSLTYLGMSFRKSDTLSNSEFYKLPDKLVFLKIKADFLCYLPIKNFPTKIKELHLGRRVKVDDFGFIKYEALALKKIFVSNQDQIIIRSQKSVLTYVEIITVIKRKKQQVFTNRRWNKACHKFEKVKK